MKSFFKGYIGVALCMAAALFTACGEDEKEEIVVDESVPEMEILSEETGFNFTSAGNDAKVLTFSTNRDWQVVRGEGDSSWLTIFEREGKAGKKVKVWIAAAENAGTEGRSASFTLNSAGKSESFTVYQAQKDAVIISDPDAFKNLSPEEQFIDIEFATNAGDYAVTYSFGTGATPWIVQVEEPVDKTRALVSHKLRFKIVANSAYTPRNGNILINSKNTAAKATVNVIQQGIIKPTISIANKTVFKDLPYEKAKVALALETNVVNLDDLEVVIPESDKKWISCGKNEEGTAYELTVEGNTSSGRSSMISVRSVKDNAIKDEMKLSQVSAPGVLITIKNKDALMKELGKLGDTFGLEYEILVDKWDVAITYEDATQTGWLEETSRKLPGKVMFKVSENTVLKNRSATIRLYNKANETVKDEVTITQSAATCIVIPSGKSLEETLIAYGVDRTVESLELKGTLSNADLTLLKTMGKSTLKKLDLSAIANTSFPEAAFMDCAKLESFVFPQHRNLKVIPAEILRKCIALKEIKIPEGVDYIDHHAFAGCSKLTSIWLPSSITYMYGYSFEQCPVIKNIHMKTKPIQHNSVYRSPSQPTVLATVFNSSTLPKGATLYVPSEYIELYKNPTPKHCISKHLQDKLNVATEWAAGWKAWFTWADANTVINGEN